MNGGTSQVAISDAIALAGAGLDVAFFCAVGPVAPQLSASGVRVVCLEQQEIGQDRNRLRAMRQGLWNSKAVWELERLLNACTRPPIVHIHGWSKALSSSVCAAALSRRATVVVSLHDYFAACPNGGFYRYPQQRLCKLRAMSAACIACNCDSRSYTQKLYRVARQAVQHAVGRLPAGVTHFVHHSRLAGDILAPYLPPHAKLYFLPMAIDVEPGERVRAEENSDFVLVGRLAPEKGVLLFADAAGKAGVTPVFAGEGKLRNALLARAPMAEITGWLSRDALRQRLARARALVFSSTCYETFGLSVAEALAQGIPCIVSDQSAAAELIQDRVTGLIFRNGDAVNLASKLNILQDTRLVAKMGRCAYETYWRTPLTVDRHVKAMLGLYESIGTIDG